MSDSSRRAALAATSASSQGSSLVEAIEDLVVAARQLPGISALSLSASIAIRTCLGAGRARQAELAQRLRVSRAGASQLLDRLEAGGLLTRRRLSGEGVSVEVTSRGAALYDTTHRARAAAVDDALAALSPRDRAALYAAAPAIARLAGLLGGRSSR